MTFDDKLLQLVMGFFGMYESKIHRTETRAQYPQSPPKARTVTQHSPTDSGNERQNEQPGMLYHHITVPPILRTLSVSCPLETVIGTV